MDAEVLEEEGDFVQFGLQGLARGGDQPDVIGIGQAVQGVTACSHIGRGLVEPFQEGVHPGDELQRRQQAALPYPRFFREGFCKAVCGDNTCEGVVVDVLHEGSQASVY